MQTFSRTEAYALKSFLFKVKVFWFERFLKTDAFHEEEHSVKTIKESRSTLSGFLEKTTKKFKSLTSLSV